VADDFGLLECSGCKAQLIVHVDGTVEYSGSPESKPKERTSVPQAEPQQVFEDSRPEFEADSVGSFEGEIEDVAEIVPEQVAEHVADELPPELGGEVVAAEMFDGNEPPDPSEAPVMYQPGNAPDSPDLSDLTEFANSSDSGGREGPLRYNLVFTGIDTSDVREAFREAITDRKFMWDTEQILRSIRQGEVRILNVAPGKAHMLISRLRNLPVKISWEQHAITQP
jgi:hypothetical protein